MTHFSDADGRAALRTRWPAFANATQDLPGERSACNSAATLRHAQDAAVRADWRAGIMLMAARPTTPSAAAWIGICNPA